MLQKSKEQKKTKTNEASSNAKSKLAVEKTISEDANPYETMREKNLKKLSVSLGVSKGDYIVEEVEGSEGYCPSYDNGANSEEDKCDDVSKVHNIFDFISIIFCYV